MIFVAKVRAARKATVRQWMLTERQRSRRDHPAGKGRTAARNVRLIENRETS